MTRFSLWITPSPTRNSRSRASASNLRSSFRPHLAADGKAQKTVKSILVGDRDPVQGDAEIAAVSGQDLGVAGQRALLAMAVLGHDEPVAAQRDAAGAGGNRAGQGFPEVGSGKGLLPPAGRREIVQCVGPG